MGQGLIGIDWGTTHRRGYLLDAQGALTAEQSDDQGMLASQGRFPAALATLLAPWPTDVPVLMSGMVGAASGWQEAPYLDAASPLTALARNLMPLRDAPAGRRCAIVPGYRWRGANGEIDVMRGEETQLLGALALGHGDGWYVLPGTHSKWVQVANGTVRSLRTYLTGELFGLLSQHGTLSSMVGATEVSRAFDEGLDAATHGGLSQTLFGCRARVVTGEMPASHARSYLSGLLIGAEWHDVVTRARAPLQQVTLISADHLAGSYQRAAQHHGCTLRMLDPRAVYLAALKALQQGLDT